MFTKLDSQSLYIYLELLSMKCVGKSITLHALTSCCEARVRMTVTPQNPRVPLTIHQSAEFLWISGNPIPHCCVPFIGIHIFKKNLTKSPLFGELYPTYNLYNSITITHLGSQQKVVIITGSICPYPQYTTISQ